MWIVLRRAGFVLLVIVLAAWTHLPVLRSGATGRDLGVVAALAPEGLAPSAAASIPSPPPRLVGASLSALAAAPDVFGQEFGAGNVHVAQLVLLLLAALGASLSARQALEPWIGAEGAAGVGRATALLVPLHPLAGAAIASFEAHGVLIASAAGALAAASFLRARRAESPARLFAAFLLLALAAAAGRAASVFALAIVVLEWTSTRRHRPTAARVKSTVVTAVSAAAVLTVVWVLAGEREAWDFGDVAGPALVLDAATHGFEKLGVLLLPGPSSGASAARLVVLGALLVVVLHPALLAARSAPRLWGWIALTSGFLLAAGLALHPRVRVPPGALFGAHLLLPPAILLAVVVAACATALVGNRRRVLPVLCAVAWSVHGRSVLEPWPRSAEARKTFTEELRSAARDHGPCAELWVVDPPLQDDALADLPRAFAWTLHSGLGAASSTEPRRSSARVRVRATDAPTLAFALRDLSFAAVRADGLVLWLPAGFAGETSGARYALRVAPAGDPPRERVWRGDGRSPALEAAPTWIAGVKAFPLAQSPTAEAPSVAWRARDSRFEDGRSVGVWLATEDGPQAWFDLSDDVRFQLSRRIARLTFEEVLARVRSAEILSSIPTPSVPGPTIQADAWCFSAPQEPLPTLVRGEGTWTLALFDPHGLVSTRLPVERLADQSLAVRGALEFERAVKRRGSPEIAWWLEYRAGDVTLLRAGGRR